MSKYVARSNGNLASRNGNPVYVYGNPIHQYENLECPIDNLLNLTKNPASVDAYLICCINVL